MEKDPNSEKSASSKIAWMFKHKNILIPLLLILVLVVTVAYYKIQVSTLEANFIIEKNQYLDEYQEKQVALEKEYVFAVDSLNQSNAYKLSAVFSWSARAELIRGNNEQVALLMNQFIKTKGIEAVSLISPDSKRIIISTNKKIEGELFTDPEILVNPKATIENGRSVIRISGLNELIGYLVFSYQIDSPVLSSTAANN